MNATKATIVLHHTRPPLIHVFLGSTCRGPITDGTTQGTLLWLTPPSNQTYSLPWYTTCDALGILTLLYPISQKQNPELNPHEPRFGFLSKMVRYSITPSRSIMRHDIRLPLPDR